MKYPLLRIALLTIVAIATNASRGQEPVPDKPVKQLILPGESFLVENRPAFIMWPDASKRTSPQPWIMYAPTLRGLPDRHEKWMHEQFLAAGVAVAGIDVGEAYGSPKGQSQFNAFHKELTEKRGFADKPCVLGRSRGGLLVGSWAISNPEKVSGLAGIYPVFDLRSYPGIKRAAPSFGMSSDELAKQIDQLNPAAKFDILAKAEIPLFLIHGDVDRVVPLEANSGALVDQYRRAGAEKLATLIVPQGQGHNYWPGFFRNEALIDFVVRTAKAGATINPQSNQ